MQKSGVIDINDDVGSVRKVGVFNEGRIKKMRKTNSEMESQASLLHLEVGHVDNSSLVEVDGGDFGCSHYRRKCKIKTPCCDEIFDCCHCHNEVKVSKNQYHCDQCGTCRTGGQENFFHLHDIVTCFYMMYYGYMIGTSS
ncbi:hypothetical protein LXL04_033520 [Taraxacum kok-saghyz]